MNFAKILRKFSVITSFKKLVFKTDAEKPTLRLGTIWVVGIGIWVLAFAALFLENRAKAKRKLQPIVGLTQSRQMIIDLPKVKRPAVQSQISLEGSVSSAQSRTGKSQQSNGHKDELIGEARGQLVIDYSVKEKESTKLVSAPSGSSFIAQLQTTIDTRLQNTLVRLSLGKDAIYHGQTFIPKTSTLLAQARESSQSGRIELDVNRVVLPDGQEVPIAALALDSKDLSPGIRANCHSGRIGRTLSRGALNILSAGAALLVDRNLTSSAAVVAQHRSIENAGAQGLAESTKREADGLENEVKEDDYCTLGKNQSLILTLLKTFSPTGEQR